MKSADPDALLKTGSFDKGAMFVVDRFAYQEADNKSLGQADRKVVAVMALYPRSRVRPGESAGRRGTRSPCRGCDPGP